MKNAQRFVLTALVAAVALDLGSFSKFKQVWSLAFTGTATPTQSTPSHDTPVQKADLPQQTTLPTSGPDDCRKQGGVWVNGKCVIYRQVPGK